MSDHIERAAEVIGREYGPCNDGANHDGRQAQWAAEALADAGLLVTPEQQAVLDVAVAYVTGPRFRAIDEDHHNLRVAVDTLRALLTTPESTPK